MPRNLPVTHKEFPFPSGKILVSKTDLKGAITYANADFIETSGYSETELYGQGHNIVRHPDMPEAAFADMWNSIKNGKPWRGIVKNRRKNGDHYWVDAAVVPLRKNDQVMGYMSVRQEPSRQQIGEAEDLHRRVAQGQATFRRANPLGVVYRYAFNSRYTIFAVMMTVLMAASTFAATSNMPWLAGGLVLCGAILAAVSAVFMERTMCRPLEQAIHFFDQISQGNLNNNIEVNKDDLAGNLLSSLAHTQTHLRVIIDEITRAASTLQQRCADLEENMMQVSAHSDAQQDRVANVSEAIEQVSTSITHVAHNADEAAGSAQSALDLLNTGNAQMARSMDSIAQVVTTVQASSSTLNELTQSVEKIDLITKVIGEIAAQTNLLALNAAIEAARAGEQGRGFAVVADEVRNLATRTTESTSHITQIVRDIQQIAVSAASSMGEAVEEVEKGVAMLRESNATLLQITAASQQVTASAAHIAGATGEQSSATENVAKNMEHISELIGENGKSVQVVQKAANELVKTSAELQSLVGHFLSK